MKRPQTENEKELLDCLHSVMADACSFGVGAYDSCAQGAYAHGLHLLEEYGMVEITMEFGRRVIAKNIPQADTCDCGKSETCPNVTDNCGDTCKD
jgi:hypothetical protein